ncbi:MAG: hypothetical protein GX774_10100 [Armatimonadetes bacterium]|nr:hypothetical protein [Armatimonadota bacterium]
MSSHTPRARVRAALGHEEPDRVPVDLGGTFVSGIVVSAYEKLCAYLGLPAASAVAGGYHSTAPVAEEVLVRLGSDTRGVAVNTPELWTLSQEDGLRTDGWGVTWARPAQGHYYVVRSPLAGEPSVADVERLPFPDPEDPRIVEGLCERVRYLRDQTDYAVCLSLPSRLVHTIQYLRGYAEALIDLVANQAVIEALMERITDFNVRVMERVLALVGRSIDVLCVGDDLGTQKGLLLRPETYRRLIKPRQRRLLEAARRHTDATLFYHTCGSVTAVIPDLIEMGVQALNPIQVSAAEMAPERLKREYGRELVFWGAVDTQRVLPQGSPAEVAAEVRRRFRELGPGGGWVCAAVHHIQAEVPPENIVALFETARECVYAPAA